MSTLRSPKHRKMQTVCGRSDKKVDGCALLHEVSVLFKVMARK